MALCLVSYADGSFRLRPWELRDPAALLDVVHSEIDQEWLGHVTLRVTGCDGETWTVGMWHADVMTDDMPINESATDIYGLKGHMIRGNVVFTGIIGPDSVGLSPITIEALATFGHYTEPSNVFDWDLL